MKNTLSDEKLKDKFSEEEKQAIEGIVNEGLQFLESYTPRGTEYIATTTFLNREAAKN